MTPVQEPPTARHAASSSRKRAISNHSSGSRSSSPFANNNTHNMPTAISPARKQQNGSPDANGSVARKRKSSLSKKINGSGNGIYSNGNSMTSALALIGEDEKLHEVIAPKSLNEEVVLAPSPIQVGDQQEVVVVAEKKKIDWEIPRKTLHSSIGFAVVGLYLAHCTMPPVLVAVSLALVGICVMDFLRFRYPQFRTHWEKIFGPLMRESEKEKINGTVWYCIGVIFVVLLYPMDVAVVSILILSWADTAASTIGRLWGRYTPPLPRRVRYIGISYAPRKSTAGFVAAFITGGLIASTFWGLHTEAATGSETFTTPPIDAKKTWEWEQGLGGGWIGLGVLGLWTGIVTATAEAIDLGDLDDNLTLPIMAGAGLWAYLAFLKWLNLRLHDAPLMLMTR